MYNGLLINTGLNCVVHLHADFVKKYCWSSVSMHFTSVDSTNQYSNSIFDLWLWIYRCGGLTLKWCRTIHIVVHIVVIHIVSIHIVVHIVVDNTCSSTALHRRDLSILRVWYPRGILEPIPIRYQEPTVVKFLGSQNCSKFLTVQGGKGVSVLLTSMLFEGQL